MSKPVIGVVGAGAMGAGIAQVAAGAGHQVKLFDMNSKTVEQAIEGIRNQFSKMASKGKLSREQALANSTNLIAVTDLKSLNDCFLVVEAIVENLDIKQKLFADLENIVAADGILASNTSSISITAIASALQKPERLAGLHFFNPAPLMELVEVVSGLATCPRVSETLFDLAKAWGKVPVHTKSTPGFIVNRVARPYYAEAMRVYQEQGADLATIDAICREAGQFRMGPFELTDLIGHDVNYAVTCSVWNAYYNDQRFLPSLVQKELVDAKFLGKKTGRGFYNYAADAVKSEAQTVADISLTAPAIVYTDSALGAALAARLHEAKIPCTTENKSPDGAVAQVGSAYLYQTDGLTATATAAQRGIQNIVLADLALDYSSSPRLAVCRSLQAETPAVEAVFALLQAAEFKLSEIADVPGMVLMRTVAMLANEAADAVNQGVCSVADVDAAMLKGVNYPKGPLAWADAIGLVALNTVLANMAKSYGEDRYRTSPLLRQTMAAGRRFYD